jgi:TetR/AcrR family transcriptional regulator, cholesterol catabolism regulator
MTTVSKSGRGNSGQSPRRNRQHEVIEAAIEVFWEKGYADASIQDVADRVGVLKGSLYHYISSKEQLLFDILDHSHAQGVEIIQRARELEGPPLERLQRFIEDYLGWYLRNIKRVSVYFSEGRFLTGERFATVRRQQKAYDEFVRELIIEAQEAGDADASLDPRLATLFVNAAVNGVSTWYQADGRYPPDRVAKDYAELALHTLHAPCA